MSELIDYLMPDEKPRADLIVQRLSEAGKCLLTGATDDLTILPVDSDPNNVLACNMACVKRPLARDFIYTTYYSAEVHGYDVTFNTPPEFREYNISILSQLEKPETEWDFPHGNLGSEYIKVFELLTSKHCKGIARVLNEAGYMETHQYLAYVMRMREKTKVSSIIKPPSGLVSV